MRFGSSAGRRFASVGLASLLAVAFAAAAFGEEEATSVRVATLLPFVEDALREAPGDAVLVASVRRSLHAPTRADVADLGSPHSPNLEALTAARPDLTVGDAGLHARLRSQLARSGAEVLLLDTSSVDATFAGLVELGRRVGGQGAMQARVDAVRLTIAEASLEQPRTVLVLFGAPGTFYAMTERTWLGDLAGQLGFENASPAVAGAERFPGLVALSDEVVAGLTPDLVLLVSHGDPDAIRAALERRIQAGGAWRGLQQAATVEVLDPALFAANPGLGMASAARALVSLAPASVATAP